MVSITDELIGQMRDAIVREVHPEKVILFGSWARGQTDTDTESDVDFLVVEREPFGPHRSRHQEATRIWRCLYSFRVPKDVLVYSSHELQENSDRMPHVVATALKEGKILYESAKPSE